ncbi:ABC transporter permease [Granulosicoccaceae sp. 1_MG-2023]|nr:ABC transporter permease [Granulosicoccaceae sp. 1_MG-2023]
MRYLEIAFYRAYADLKTEASRSFIGFAWWVVEPIVYMLAFYVIFELGLRQGEENFLSFLLVGLIFWKWLASSILLCTGIVSANYRLLNQVYLPKWIFPLSVVTANACKAALALLVLFIFLLLNGNTPGMGWWAIVPVILAQLLLISGVGFLAAAVTPFFRELKLLIDNGILALMFLSGVFFNLDKMEESVRAVLMLNPVAILLRDARSVLLDNHLPPDHGLYYVVAAALLMLALAFYLFIRFDRVYPKVLRP